MARRVRGYLPAMSDIAVGAKTGKTWKQWFALLDKAGAAQLDHKSIVKLVGGTGRAGPWWRQMVAVEYERARGLRAIHQTATGYTVSMSKTLQVDVTELFIATVDVKLRKKWFPEGDLKISSLTDNKYFRGEWNGTARLEINFYSKPGGKAQIVVQVNKLARKSYVPRERALWKKALMELQTLLGV